MNTIVTRILPVPIWCIVEQQAIAQTGIQFLLPIHTTIAVALGLLKFMQADHVHFMQQAMIVGSTILLTREEDTLITTLITIHHA